MNDGWILFFILAAYTGGFFNGRQYQMLRDWAKDIAKRKKSK